MPADTLPDALRPLMQAPSVELDHCAICGRAWPLNQHHVVRRGAGEVYRHGVPLPKPTITLCGSGNALADADGRRYCHGMAHHQMLHFRWVPSQVSYEAHNAQHEGGGHMEYKITPEPTPYVTALASEDGWKRVRTR